MLFLAFNVILLSGFGLILKHAKNNQQRVNNPGFLKETGAFDSRRFPSDTLEG